MKMQDAFPNAANSQKKDSGGGFVKAVDLMGRTITVTIDRVEMKMLPNIYKGHTMEPNLIIYFRGAQKAMVLGEKKALAMSIQLGSDDTDTWVGRTIELYPEKMVDGKLALKFRVIPKEGEK